METLKLIMGLYDTNAKTRNHSALIIGMVQETSALGALQQRFREEPDDSIKQTLFWAGKRVEQAIKAGYNTVDAIFEHFQINREIASGLDPEEADAWRHSSSTTSTGSGFSNIKMGSMLSADNLKTGNLAGERRQSHQALLRLPPMQTSDMDIRFKLKRLMDMSQPKRQKNSALELADINNPEALPYLGWIVFIHEIEDVRQAAEKAGKLIYWNVNYALMVRDGRLNLEMDKRRGKLHGNVRSVTPVTPVQNQQEDLAAILNQAQKNRKQRKR